jgi:uncharacterized protein YecE (DUF72 family)
MAHLLVGTSGWNYGPWKDGLYAGVRRQDWLAHYATRFDAVEVNASFYRAVRPATYAAWRAATPERFRFAIKGHRLVTHVNRLSDATEPVMRQRDSASVLGDRLAAVLWQLPQSVRKDAERLKAFLAVLHRWPEVPHVMEFRHASWFDTETADLLAAHGVASAISDADRWPRWDVITGDLVYIRLHGRPHCYLSPYPVEAVADWAARIRAWQAEGNAVQIYFDNTMQGAAVDDSLRLRGFLRRPFPRDGGAILCAGGQRRPAPLGKDAAHSKD